MDDAYIYCPLLNDNEIDLDLEEERHEPAPEVLETPYTDWSV